jgi:flagellar biosynthesis protein FliR
MKFTSTEIIAWISGYMWPFTRIAAMVSVVPIFGTQTVPKRIRLGIAVVLTLVIAPLVPPIGNIQPFSIGGVIVTVQQLLIGLAMGFAVRLVFSALEYAGNSIAMLMGLGFAEMMDPQSGVDVPMISQFFTIIASLLFLTFDGHLVLVQVMAESFHTLPVSMSGLSKNGLWQLVLWASWVFSGAVLIALPAVASLLIVNMAFGVMTRAAPQLNIFAVGFPLTLGLGFIVVMLTLPSLVPKFSRLLTQSIDLVRYITSPGG